MAKSESAASVAKNNLKNGLSSPGAKIGIAVLLIAFVVVMTMGFRQTRKSDIPVGKATGGNYEVANSAPTGAVADSTAVKQADALSNAKADQAMENGRSYAAPFIFEAEKAPSFNVGADFESQAMQKSGNAQSTATLLSDLRAKAQELTVAEQRKQGNPTTVATAQGNYTDYANCSTGIPGNCTVQPQRQVTNSQGQQQGGTPNDLTGVKHEKFVKQLDAINRPGMSFASLPDGVLSTESKQQGTQSKTTGSANNPVTSSGLGTANAAVATTQQPKTTRVATAGTVCPVELSTAINTDFNVPAFMKVLDCGPLTGVTAKGAVVKGASDFVITGGELYAQPTHKFTIAGKTEFMSLSLDNDGYAGVAEDVDNHWGSRLASAGLLSLAKTEKEFLRNRGTSTIQNGVSSSTVVEPYSSKEKQEARIAGLMEGTMDVVTKDMNVGVNRPPTMRRGRGTAIGIQFLTNVEVVYEQ